VLPTAPKKLKITKDIYRKRAVTFQQLVASTKGTVTIITAASIQDNLQVREMINVPDYNR
jgi:hypothetical protein